MLCRYLKGGFSYVITFSEIFPKEEEIHPRHQLGLPTMILTALWGVALLAGELTLYFEDAGELSPIFFPKNSLAKGKSSPCIQARSSAQG